MRGGELLPFYGDSKPNWTNLSWNQFMNRLGRTFVSWFVKNFTQLGWRECDSKSECQLARPLWRISPIGASYAQWNCANGKRVVFMGFLQNMSSGKIKFILRGIQCKCFQVMSLLTGPEMSPPRCGRRGIRDGDKLLCNRCPLKHEARERERGEIPYKNMANRKHYRRKTCMEKYNWYLKYMMYVVWAQPSIAEYIRI